MSPHIREKRPSEILEDVVEHHSQHDYITIKEIKLALHERGFGILMIIFAAIMIVCPPFAGLAPALPIILCAIQMMMGKDSPWLPKWLSKQKVKRKSLAKLIQKSNPKLRKIERLLKPRLLFMSSSIGERFVGVFAFVFAISIVVPLPLTNFVPSVGIILMSLGMMSKDGVLILLGMLVGTVGVTITLSILWVSEALLNSLF